MQYSLAATCLLAAFACTVQAETAFIHLGVVSGQTSSRSLGVSNNGSVVVGSSGPQATSHAFRWTSAGGMQDLGSLGGAQSVAYGASADGSVVVGLSRNAEARRRAFRWTVDEGMLDLGTLPGSNSSWANAVSHDGSVVVGASGSLTAFRWTGSTGLQALSRAPGQVSDEAFAVNSDGSVAVGWGADSSGASHAVRWVGTDPGQDLGVLPGMTYSMARSVSADGNVIVGFSSTDAAARGFRWTPTGGMQAIDPLFGNNFLFLMDLSNDGSVLVGASSLDGSLSPGDGRAVIWTSAHGLMDLNTLLPSLGVNLESWTLERVDAISPDGTVIAGRGMFNGEERAWLVTGLSVPAPGAFSFLAALGFSTLRRRPRRR